MKKIIEDRIILATKEKYRVSCRTSGPVTLERYRYVSSYQSQTGDGSRAGVGVNFVHCLNLLIWCSWITQNSSSLFSF